MLNKHRQILALNSILLETLGIDDGGETLGLRLGEMISTQHLPCILNAESTMGEWLADPRDAQVLQTLLEQMPVQMAAETGPDAEGIGMEMMAFLKDMPIGPILHLFGGQLPAPPEQIVAGLLAQVRAEKA